MAVATVIQTISTITASEGSFNFQIDVDVSYKGKTIRDSYLLADLGLTVQENQDLADQLTVLHDKIAAKIIADFAITG